MLLAFQGLVQVIVVILFPFNVQSGSEGYSWDLTKMWFVNRDNDKYIDI